MIFERRNSGSIHKRLKDRGPFNLACMMEDEEYRAAPGINSSSLKQFRKSPAHYQEYLKGPTRDTPSLMFGRVVDAILLDPEYYKRTFSTTEQTKPKKPERPEELKNIREKRTDPDCPVRKWKEESQTLYNAAMRRYEEVVRDKTIIPAAYEAKAIAMKLRVMKHPKARLLLTGGIPKLTLFWVSALGEQCKAQLDYLSPALGLVDYKTSVNTSPHVFKKDAIKYGYHHQQAFYLAGLRTVLPEMPQTSWIVAQEKDGPLGLRVFNLSPELLEIANEENEYAMTKLLECMSVDDWPCYNTNVIDFDVPKWMEV